MDVILHRAAHDRVREQLADVADKVNFLCMEVGGGFTLDGAAVELSDYAPEGFWLSMDMIPDGLVPASFDLMCAGSVKWMQTFNAGLDNPRYADVAKAGVRVTNSSAQAVAIAEYTLAQVLSVTQPIDQQRAAQAAREWKRIPFRELSRMTWLIVGYGHIGKETAKRAAAFGSRILVVRRGDTPADLAEVTAKMDALPELLPQADVIVLACPITDETRDMADEKFFAAVKPGAILVNIARGGLIVEDAILQNLDNDGLEIAILDVFEPEPLPAESPFWAHPRVRVTGHTSFNGNGTFARGDDLFVNNLRHYLAGEALDNEVDLAAFMEGGG